MRVDAAGNPMVCDPGCPMCSRGARWLTIPEVVAMHNAGSDLGAPCSRRCALQLEYARSLAARDAVEVAEAITHSAALTQEGEYARNQQEAVEHIRTLPPSERSAVANRPGQAPPSTQQNPSGGA